MERATPECPNDGLLLRTEAVSVCSTDVSYYKGHLTPEQWPIVPGHEYVGRVCAVGKELLGRAEEGQIVAYWGQTDFDGLAQYRAIRPIFPGTDGHETNWYTDRGFVDAHQAAALILPPTSDPSRMTMIEPLTSVMRAVLTNPPNPGDTVVVLGAGPIGLLATQVLVRFFGVADVIVLETDSARRAASLALGASMAYDPDADEWELRKLATKFSGAVADYVLDTLPHIGPTNSQPDVRAIAMSMLRINGTYVVFGATSIPQNIDTWALLSKGLRITAAPFDVRSFPMARTAHVMKAAFNLLSSNIIDTDLLISDTVEFFDERAVRNVFASYGRGGRLKTVITADGSDHEILR
ncbi:zinc-dependent alcohol dehydrogenase [Nocardia brasiliensis]|uniref:zinc-dependent alcohol dehydrogenase n=1 Tax=Nocardia brasiliensis TaxID=37326 RepID=UPI002458E30A|nr:medium chain dehydrogenase/reductase family protein [Nocardia brasiliensis]